MWIFNYFDRIQFILVEPIILVESNYNYFYEDGFSKRITNGMIFPKNDQGKNKAFQKLSKELIPSLIAFHSSIDESVLLENLLRR
jgi:hypothetical protein